MTAITWGVTEQERFDVSNLTCNICQTKLTGRQQRYCSKPCSIRGNSIDRLTSGKLRKEAMTPEQWAKKLERNRNWKQSNPEAVKKTRPWGRGSKAWIDSPSRLSLLERDEWTCKLCDQPIPQKMKYNRDKFNPLWPSLDHIKPKSQGGTDDHNNLQASHLYCNTIKHKQSNWIANSALIEHIKKLIENECLNK